MIKAVFVYQDAEIKGFTVAGHAATSVQGTIDLVCASVSAVTQTALLGLDAYLGSKFQWTINDDGFLECWLSEELTLEEREKATIIIHTVELGLMCMEESYGQYLKVSKRRWTKCCSK